jgi:hypothetical protein
MIAIIFFAHHIFHLHHKDTKSLRLQNYSLDAMLDQRHIEVDQKAKSLLGQLQLGQELSQENRMHSLRTA